MNFSGGSSKTGHLLLTHPQIRDKQSLNSVLLFFTVPSIKNTDMSASIECNCIFCYQSVTLHFKKGSGSLNTTALEKHLDTTHFGLYSQIRCLHPKLDSLFTNEVKSISSFFH